MNRTCPERSVAPTPGPPPEVGLPVPARSTLAGGLPVLALGDRGLPLANVEVLVPLPLAAGPPVAGLAAFVADMLDEGSEVRSALEFAAALERIGAVLHSTAGYDAAWVELSVLSRRLPEALELLAEALRRPAFDAGEMDRVRGQRLTRLQQELDEPRALANQAFAQALYGPGHPYGVPLLGTQASLTSLTPADVAVFHGARYHPGNATAIVAGDAGAGELTARLQEALGGWTAPPAYAPPDAPTGAFPRQPEAGPSPAGEGRGPARSAAPRGAGARFTLVARPGAPQSELRVGKVAVDRATDDYFALTILNTILGGAFTSRLNARLREEKGYTYGAGSGFHMRRSPGPFVAQAAVHTPATADAVTVVLEEVRRMAEERVGADELERARRYTALRLPQRFETAADVSTRMAELVLYGLPADYYETYVERMMAVSAEEVRDAASRHLDPEQMIVVVAGDEAEVRRPLEALGLGEVRAWSPDAQAASPQMEG